MVAVSRPVTLPHPVLPDADWADRFTLPVPGSGLTATAAAELCLGHMPGWVRALMSLRNRLVAPFGLKAAPYPSSSSIGGFPVVSRSDERVVLGLDDRHLDFRIVIDVRPNRPDGQTVGVTTLVRRKNLSGRAYLAVVAPFHRLIVPTVLEGIGRRLPKLPSD